MRGDRGSNSCFRGKFQRPITAETAIKQLSTARAAESLWKALSIPTSVSIIAHRPSGRWKLPMANNWQLPCAHRKIRHLQRVEGSKLPNPSRHPPFIRISSADHRLPKPPYPVRHRRPGFADLRPCRPDPRREMMSACMAAHLLALLCARKVCLPADCHQGYPQHARAPQCN